MLRMRFVRLLVLFCITCACLGISQSALARQPALFKITDFSGDDYGDGTLVYPLGDDMAPGDLDLVSLAAYPEKNGTAFIATFARPIRVPGYETTDASGTTIAHYARFGFYTFNLDIYVDTDRVPGSGNQFTLPGRNIEVHRTSAWEKAILLTPRPYEARIMLERFLRTTAENTLEKEKGGLNSEDKKRIKEEARREANEKFFFPTRIRVFSRTVEFFVPDKFLSGHARDNWSYAVAVSGADLIIRSNLLSWLGLRRQTEANFMVLPVAMGRSTETFGSSREEESYQPPIVDVIVPKGVTQEELLAGTETSHELMIKLRGVVPAEQ